MYWFLIPLLFCSLCNPTLQSCLIIHHWSELEIGCTTIWDRCWEMVLTGLILYIQYRDEVRDMGQESRFPLKLWNWWRSLEKSTFPLSSEVQLTRELPHKKLYKLLTITQTYSSNGVNFTCLIKSLISLCTCGPNVKWTL